MSFSITYAQKGNVSEFKAVRTSTPPKIDGVVEEEEWKGAFVTKNFYQMAPNAGEQSTQPTTAMLFYDDNALYVAGILLDSTAGGISKLYSNRDDRKEMLANMDLFGFDLDTYNDDQNCYSFLVSTTGVQIDSRISPNGDDYAWNAVWQSAITTDENGWYVEMRIPYTAIRFPEKKEHKWGIVFYREVDSNREYDLSPFVDPRKNTYVNQFADLTGIKDIKSPLRLSLMPYLSTYLEHFPFNIPGKSNYSKSLNAGMDLKYGLSDAFTLDMTLIPDFGQVQSDNQVLNLSPFEVEFQENRQFFTEGTELFNKSGIFYSRRVGGTPLNYYNIYNEIGSGEELISNPGQSQLLNATKVSGRTGKGLGIGVFNALTRATYATIRDSIGNDRQVLTDPLTNYSVIVLDQNLKNNSYVNYTNTGVWRDGNSYDANSHSLTSSLFNKKASYAIETRFKLSQKTGRDFTTPERGCATGLVLRKTKGNFQFNSWARRISENFDPNDLGFNWFSNYQEFGFWNKYSPYKQIGKIRQLEITSYLFHQRLLSPNVYTKLETKASVKTQWERFNSVTLDFIINPIEEHDYYEPRVSGRYQSKPISYNLGMIYDTDSRKNFTLNIASMYMGAAQKARYGHDFRITPSWRPNDRLDMNLQFIRTKFHNDEGVALVNTTGGVIMQGNDPVFGKRDLTIHENVLNVGYIFTNKMGVNFRLRHYWSTVKYHDYYVLNGNGSLRDTSYTGIDTTSASIHDNSFDAFNIDLVYKWVFAPGSELSVVWKNSIFKSETFVPDGYFMNLENALSSHQTNSISFKMLYYLDAARFSKRS